MLVSSGCRKQKQLGEIANLIVSGDELALEKIEKLKDVSVYVEYQYIDLPEGVIQERDKGNSISLLSLACAVGNEDVINMLIDMEVNPGEALPDKAGAYPLEYFCQSGFESGSYLLEKLIDAGGNPEDYMVEAPVFRLADNMKKEEQASEELMEELLILVDRDVSWVSKSIKHDGEHLLHISATIEDGELLETLIEYDKSDEYINAKDGTGATPIMSAVNAGCWNNVVGLICHGADTQITDNSGMSARGIAECTKNTTIINIFKMSEGLQ